MVTKLKKSMLYLSDVEHNVSLEADAHTYGPNLSIQGPEVDESEPARHGFQERTI